MIAALRILVPIALIWVALGLTCALWVGRRRRTGDGQVAADPYFYPFGEMPIVPVERHLIASDFRAWGIPKTKLTPSAGALRRNESGGRPASLSGTAAVLTFPKKD